MPPVESTHTLSSILQACKEQRNAILLFTKILRDGLAAHISTGDYLVSMLIQHGVLNYAKKAFNGFICPTHSLWNSIIYGYIKAGDLSHAMLLYKNMQELNNISLIKESTLVALLKTCTKNKALFLGYEIHVDIARVGLLQNDHILCCSLVDLYAKCGSMSKAEEVFRELHIRNAVSWTALINGYVEQQNGEIALQCFDRMQGDGITPDSVTFVCTLKACTSLEALRKGQELHISIMKHGLETDINVGSTLVDMYAKTGLITDAQSVFDKMPVQNEVLWSALIVGYTEHGFASKAVEQFKNMQMKGIPEDGVMCTAILKACCMLSSIEDVQALHVLIIKKGHEMDIMIANTLIDTYAKCALLAEAQKVFNVLQFPISVSWNALISGLVEHGDAKEAIRLFKSMDCAVVPPDVVTLALVLKACSVLRSTSEGQRIHAEICKKGIECETFIGNTLIDMYARCCLLSDAQEICNKLPFRDVASWTSLIMAYTEHGNYTEALQCFDSMQLDGVSPDEAVFVCSIKACAGMGAVDKAKELHAEITRRMLYKDVTIGSMMLDMYAQSGYIAKSHEVFDDLPVQNVVSYNALIAGYSQAGQNEQAFNVFNTMVVDNLQPDKVTFLSILTVCCHTGLLNEALMYLDVMSRGFSINPIIEHYNCFVDLLGRAGVVEMAVALIERMPFHPGALVWHSVLGACQRCGDMDFGKQGFDHLLQLNAMDKATYVGMINIFASSDYCHSGSSFEFQQG